jgi:predicted dehydrogenase
MSAKVAFIGAGSIAQAHLDALRLVGAEIVGVCTRGESGERFAAQNGIAVYTSDPVALIEASRPDALFLLTQPAAYQGLLESVRSFNLPTLIEKPLGNTVIEAEALCSVLPEKTFVGLNRRFYSNIRPILPMLQEEPPFMALVAMPEREKDYGQYDNAAIRNHWDMLQGIHLVDLVTCLAGPCEQIFSHTQWGELPLTTTPQYTMAMYETTRRNRVAFMSNFDSPGGWRIHLFLKKKEIIVAPLEKTVIRSLSGIEELPVTERDQQAKPGFVAQVECFLQGLQTDRLPADWVGFDDALASMRTLETVFPTKALVSV